MKIQTYVKKNFEKLPKSTFNGDELVIVEQINHSDHGYGHHSYEGIGVDKDGKTFWCFSSGCSCDGSCGITHEPDMKKFQTDSFDLSKLKAETVNFIGLQVDFADYG